MSITLKVNILKLKWSSTSEYVSYSNGSLYSIRVYKYAYTIKHDSHGHAHSPSLSNYVVEGTLLTPTLNTLPLWSEGVTALLLYMINKSIDGYSNYEGWVDKREI